MPAQWPAFDHVVSDRVVAPVERAGEEVAESLLVLPHSYQPQDPAREVDASDAGTALHELRKRAGLPETAFVFACFVRPQKLDSSMFAAWTAALLRTPGSTLWLLSGSPGYAVLRALGLPHPSPHPGPCVQRRAQLARAGQRPRRPPLSPRVRGPRPQGPPPRPPPPGRRYAGRPVVQLAHHGVGRALGGRAVADPGGGGLLQPRGVEVRAELPAPDTGHTAHCPCLPASCAPQASPPSSPRRWRTTASRRRPSLPTTAAAP